MVRVIAHRGASAAAPENTVEAFRLARELGADWVELDARRTADGRVVVHHDAHLADGRAIFKTNRSDLPDSVVELSEALDACAGMAVNIEIKNHPIDVDFDASEAVAQQVVEEVQGRDCRDDVIVSCFHLPTIDRIRALDQGIPTAFLHHVYEGTLEDMIAGVASGGHQALHPWDGLVDGQYMTLARQHGLQVNVWTVDDPVRMQQLVELGVDGICTNVPDVARQLIG